MAYELWAPNYPPRAHNALMRTEQAAMEPILASLSASRALDVGTGSGRYLPLLARTGARIVLGLDLSPAMLMRGGGEFQRVCADACRLPLARGAFDLAVAALMVGDVEDLGRWTGELARILAPGGHLLYSDFHPCWTGHRWERTFETIDGRRVSVPYFARSLEQHLAALMAVGLQVRAIREARLCDQADPGIDALRQRWGDPPVVVVFHAQKPEAGRDPRVESVERGTWPAPVQ